MRALVGVGEDAPKKVILQLTVFKLNFLAHLMTFWSCSRPSIQSHLTAFSYKHTHTYSLSLTLLLFFHCTTDFFNLKSQHKDSGLWKQHLLLAGLLLMISNVMLLGKALNASLIWPKQQAQLMKHESRVSLITCDFKPRDISKFFLYTLFLDFKKSSLLPCNLRIIKFKCIV